MINVERIIELIVISFNSIYFTYNHLNDDALNIDIAKLIFEYFI